MLSTSIKLAIHGWNFYYFESVFFIDKKKNLFILFHRGQKKSIINKYSLQSAVCALHWLATGIVFASIDGRVKFIQAHTNKMSTLINVPNSICVSMCYNQDQIIAGFLNGQIWSNSLTSNLRESSAQLLANHPTPPFALALTSNKL